MAIVPPNHSTLVLLSGGLDSSVLLHFLTREKNERVQALFFDFGQTAVDYERQAANRVWETVDGSGAVAEVSLRQWREGFDHVRDTKPSLGMGHLPRNAILPLLAVPYARMMDCRWIAIGSTTEDTGMPDSDESFVSEINRLLRQVNQPELVAAPWLWEDPGWDKQRIVSWALRELGEEFVAITHSCYAPTDSGEHAPHCGRCGACKKRFAALDAARLAT